MIVISQGAEAIIYKAEYLGKPCIIKERLSKAYRLEQLDKKINLKRFQQEVRCISKCINAGILVPTIYFVDKLQLKLHLEFIDGFTLKHQIQAGLEDAKYRIYLDQLGKSLANLHDEGIFHGDLTTSNIMIEANTHRLFLIDFGLAMSQCSVEDKAVDLYVLERSFTSTHPKCEQYFAQILSMYEASSAKGAEVCAKLEKVRQRGRKRDMIG